MSRPVAVLSSTVRARLVALAVAGVSLVGPAAGAAQTSDSAAGPATARRVDGKVLVARDSVSRPVVGTWVTLHRVGADRAGPLDSVRTDARGAYGFRYTATGSDEALYFASTRYGGVAYFTSPLKGEIVRGEPAEITVFDTTSAHVPVTVRGRHLVVAAPAGDGSRSVIEVFELSNDSSVTRIEGASAAAGTWSTPVPSRATKFEVREGEVPADALALDRGRAVLHMPLAPGLKQIAFSYLLPADAFPLDVTTETPVSVLEVLVEDPKGTVTAPRVVGVDPVTVEGRSFRRFLGQDVRPRSRLVVDLPAPTPSWIRWIVPGVLGLVGLAMVATLARPRRRLAASVPAASAPTGPPDDAERLARAIAALDDEFERDPDPSDDARARYDARRRSLKGEFAAAMGRPGGRH
ncbi:MAG: hypothetical protein JO180_01360 [Gemmatirosa sp.]|nr:hypothetical protein [Gemmatirosa sp.]